MSDDTNKDAGADEQAAADAAAKAAQEQAEKAAADAAAKAQSDEQARAEGFVDAQAKADAVAAAAKPKAERKPRQAKPKSPASPPIVKTLGIEAAMERVASGSHGGFAVGFGDERGPHRDLPPVPAPSCSQRRGQIVTNDRLVIRTRDLGKPTVISHAWLYDGDDALTVRELAAPVMISPGEQFVIEPGRFAFF